MSHQYPRGTQCGALLFWGSINSRVTRRQSRIWATNLRLSSGFWLNQNVIKWSCKLWTLCSNSSSLCSQMKLFHSWLPWSKDHLLRNKLEFYVLSDLVILHFQETPIRWMNKIKNNQKWLWCLSQWTCNYLVWAAAPVTPQQTLPGASDSWHSDVKLSLNLSCIHERWTISKTVNTFKKRFSYHHHSVRSFPIF